MLEDARDDAIESGITILEALRVKERAASKSISGGSIEVTSANGRMVKISADGSIPGNMTQLEAVDAWRHLIDRSTDGLRWLKFCYRYGLDPFQAMIDRVGNPPGPEAASPTTPTDDDLYEWLMGSNSLPDSTRTWPGVPGIGYAVTECMSDYTSARTAGGLQYT
jgi:hypothetical protein